MALAIVLLSTFSLHELYTVLHLGRFYQFIGYAANLLMILLLFIQKTPSLPFLSGFSLLLLLALVAGKIFDPAHFSFCPISFVFLGFLMISETLGLALFLRLMNQGAWWLFLEVAATSLCDTGAFFAGNAWGKHKLMPDVSPGKTVEGVIGGISFSLLAALFIGSVLRIPFSHRIILGVVLALAAITGDLLESFLKRKAGVKDSGAILAGHGGILDRLDSHFLAIPALVLYKACFLT